MIIMTGSFGCLECEEALHRKIPEKCRKLVEKEYETLTKNEVFRIFERPKESVLPTR
jgi:hypothetical protein